MSNFIPDSLTYELQDEPEPVILHRATAYLTSPATTHTSNSSNVIRYTITGNQMVDLSSITLFGTITAAVAGTTTVMPGGTSATSGMMQDTYSLFQTLEVSTANGQMIERITDAHILGKIVKNMSFSEAWMDTAGTFENVHHSSYLRDNGGGPEYQIGALKLLGFLNCGKYIIPSNFGGGIMISLTMLQASEACIGRHADNTFTWSLANPRLYYDVCTMDQSYVDWYRRQYQSKGFRIVFDSHAMTSNTMNQSGGSQQLLVSASAKRCKALIAVARRNDTITSAVVDSTAFKANGYLSHQLEINGTRYPPTPINSYSRAHYECLKTCYATHDVTRSCMTFDQFTNDWALASGDDASLRYGQFQMAIDLEKFSTVGGSGVTIPPTGANLIIEWDGSTLNNQAHRIDVCLIHSRSVTVVDGSVQVDF